MSDQRAGLTARDWARFGAQTTVYAAVVAVEVWMLLRVLSWK